LGPESIALMLQHLQINNYALIESLSIDLGEGFTVITGETGAGKSILLGALSLVLGQRADTQVLNDPGRKCIIEASFRIDSPGLMPLFESNQLDFEPDTIIRREITPHGKSRAFINDTPVNLQVLKEITGKLIDIHSQHQNLLLGDSTFQFDALDGYGGNPEAGRRYAGHYRDWLIAGRELRELEERERKLFADQDYYRFQFDELDKAGLDAEEAGSWEEELEMLRNAEEIGLSLKKSAYLLVEGEVTAQSMLYDILTQMKPLGQFRANFAEIVSRLESLLIEVKEIGREIQGLSGEVVHDPERARELELKTDLLNKLFLKHHVNNVRDLIRIKSEYLEKIQAAESVSDQVSECKERCRNLENRMMEAAGELTLVRRKAIPGMEKEIRHLLQSLGMPAARFRILLEKADSPGPGGMDKLKFLFSANPGIEPGELSRIASGGELSRLMLSIKSMVSRKNLLSSIIFDEIDTGISGEIGGKIGKILQALSAKMQVIAITHLPQIAALGNSHFQVYKVVENGKTATRVKPLNKENRILEIAKMLGGDTPTQSMVQTAEELMLNKSNP
jgi:DNA repair protein RecN (Recombination protein N)